MSASDKIAEYLQRPFNRAVREFNLIEDGDRIAVGVSGGKDSRVLLELLLRGVNIQGAYEVVAVHIEGTDVGLPDQRPSLEPWFRALGVEYEIAPLAVAANEPLPMNCFRCSWNRRKALFFAADRWGCNKVALGHHADDAAVTTLLNVLYQGRAESLVPHRTFFEGRFIVIRPLIYVEECAISRYARARGWEFPPELECPRIAASRRTKVVEFLRSLNKREYERVRANLWRLGSEV
ncbi:MAG: tRNA 2-thiocytidine biosynthesis TtcA family protein [Chloroflexota bacterium]|nr:tRNA 2-thiocytidine biosynthesis TtcA family protein [Chloroflexota bacterium]